MTSSISVFIIVADCLSASAGAEGPGSPTSLESYRAIRTESTEFRNAVAPSSWTVPSHASLFTGWYPWSHEVHTGGHSSLRPSLPTLGSILSRHGYATASFSANPFISPETNLNAGFQTSLWGAWQDLYLRGLPTHLSVRQPNRAVDFSLKRRPRTWLDSSLQPALDRFPLLPDLALRTAGRVLGAKEPSFERHSVAPWVEPAFERFLAGVDSDTPVFVFVNLLDAHEPFLGLWPYGRPLLAYLSLLQTRQDRDAWLKGRWNPTGTELAKLKELYTISLRTLDRRLNRLVNAIRAARRWEESLLVLTSDHGQSLEAEAPLFHQYGLTDAQVRIPLLVKFPQGENRGLVSSSMASLVDVFPTTLDTLGFEHPESDGVDLVGCIRSARGSPVYSMSDGVPGRIQRLMSPSLVARFNLARGLQFDTKGVAEFEAPTIKELATLMLSRLDPHQRSQVFKQPSDPVAGPGNPEGGGVRRARPGEAERLGGWGY